MTKTSSPEEIAYQPLSGRLSFGFRAVQVYTEVLKPKETALLTFIGLGAAIIAGQGYPPLPLLLAAFVTIALGSAGVNGLTNYLDREVDAKMRRTRYRALPSKRIYPPERVLPLVISLVVIALALAWLLHPLAFVAGLVGTVAALIGRKTPITHLLGGISGCATVLIGWLAVNPNLNSTLLFLCILILVWVPLHVWSLMTAYRNDYLQAGIRMFPVSWSTAAATRVLMALSLVVYLVSIGLYRAGGFGWLYLGVANILGIAMIYANWRLLVTGFEQNAWRVYKLSAYPYLGVIFLVMCLDFWL